MSSANTTLTDYQRDNLRKAMYAIGMDKELRRLFDYKCWVMGISSPAIIVKPNGEIENHLDDRTKKLLDKADELIYDRQKSIAKAFDCKLEITP